MASQTAFVIVGGGLAGAKAAETLRSEGFDGRVVLLGEEPVRPYERPPLSKEYLRGEKSFEDAAVHSAGFYAEQGIELRTSAAVRALDLAAKEIILASGERIAYDRLLLATGSVPRRLSVPGAQLDGVLTLRTLADADALAARIRPGAKVVVVGAGWIGSEVAASARQMGAEVAMVDVAPLPLLGAVGPELGALYRDLHAEHGVALALGTGVASFEGAGRLEAVRLSDGRLLEAEVAVVGVGAEPRVELAETAGLVLDGGVAVDEHLATSAPGVFAAGDVASAYHPRYRRRIRVEHWSAALNQGPAAARSMLGQDVSYDRTPYFYSDQYDLGMEYRGYALHYDQVVIRGSLDERRFLAFWLRDGTVVAAMNANIWDAGSALARLTASPQRVDPAVLADPAIALEEITDRSGA
jgi:3-phenylpropionate/trans-cinnamate dioxygenase ferredoxin reductase subunit